MGILYTYFSYPPVKVWPIDLLHANDVGVEVETPPNVAHHDGDVVRLDWIGF